MKKLPWLVLLTGCTFFKPYSSKEIREIFGEREVNSIQELIRNADSLICDSVNGISFCYNNFIDSVYTLSKDARLSYVSRRKLDGLRLEFNEFIDSSLFDIFWVKKEIVIRNYEESDQIIIWNVNRNKYLKFLQAVSNPRNDFESFP